MENGNRCHFNCPSWALLNDLYEFTMAHGYWKAKLEKTQAAFYMAYRHNPFQGGYALACGLEAVVEFIENFHFEPSDLEYLAGLQGYDDKPLFDGGFLDYLDHYKFACDVDMVPEGTPVFPHEPLVRVVGPLIQAQLLETPLLSLINFPTLIATKAARVCQAAKGDFVIEFGLRRAQGINGGLTASRAAFIGGCQATSNLLAGKVFGIPVRGTQAHSWVQVFDDEQQSFLVYGETSPNNCILLVDTYNTIEGVKKAIATGLRLKEKGCKLQGIRLDSGDLAYLSIVARKMLDEAGFKETQIVASNELDEHVITEMKHQGAQVTVWGVGTNLVTAKDHPALDGVYKLSAVRHPGKDWDYKLKLSEQMIKVSNPGLLQVRRYRSGEENVADVVYDIGKGTLTGCVAVDPFDPTRRKVLDGGMRSYDLLVPVFRGGKRVYSLPSLAEIQQHVKKELAHFHWGVKRFLNPHQYVVGMEKSLYDYKIDLINRTRHREKI